MIKPYLNRAFTGIPVGVYQNLNTLEWSVRALAGPDKGKKVAEGDSLTLVDCGAFVRLSTRDRLVAARANPGAGKGAKGHKEVHAWLTGLVVPDDVVPVDPALRVHRAVTYRPFDRPEFFYPDTGEVFTGAPVLTFWSDRRVYTVAHLDTREAIRARCGI